MKKFILGLALISTAAFLTSCGDDEDCYSCVDDAATTSSFEFCEGEDMIVVDGDTIEFDGNATGAQISASFALIGITCTKK